jgi:glutamine synthetase
VKPHDVKTASDAASILEERGQTHVKLGIVDLDGVLRGKYVSKGKFLSGLENGLGFCDVVLGWDVDDRCYDNVTITGWHTGFPDAHVRIVPESCREIPFESGTLFFLCQFSPPTSEICPRSVLQKVLNRAADMGFAAYAAFEYEFFMFEETPHSIREKGYRNLRPWTPGSFGYSVLRNTTEADFYHLLLSTCDKMDIPLEGLHTETGPGVLEACITVDTGLRAADKAVLFKTFAKALAQQQGLLATFMAKWSQDEAGQGGHIHMSLQGEGGQAVFHDLAQPYSISDTMRYFIGGQQHLMPEFMAMVGSTVNSYSRLVPGLWAPTNATWAVDNRTTAIRAIPGSEKSQRVEYRVAAADANPYLALSAALASGLWGIEHRIEPDSPITGNAYQTPHTDSRHLPATLWEAAQALKESSVAREIFGDTFVDHYASSREWEERQFRKHVTDWELARYLEII